MRSTPPSITWADDHHFSIDGIEFQCGTLEQLQALPQTPLRIVKPRTTVEQCITLAQDLQPDRILELGIFLGGSTAMLAALMQPEKLVAVDIRQDRRPPLDDFIAAQGLAESVEARYSIDQSNRTQLGGVLDEAFGDAPLDLVIDDASHIRDLTRASFELVFPRVRTGGKFIIEDWRTPGLTPIVYELILLMGKGIADITITMPWTVVTRDDTPLDPEEFRLPEPRPL